MSDIKFGRISSNDEVFKNPEYISDSIIFNAIETAKNNADYNLYSDHKNVIIMTARKGHKVWIWTAFSIKDDANKLIDICRFLRDCNIPKAEIYLKQEVAGNFSDLYAITTLELNYNVKEELSLGVFTYDGEKNDNITLANDEKIISVDNKNQSDISMIRDFYTQLKDEFKWNEKFERKLSEYLDMEMYAIAKNGKIIANTAIGGLSEKFLRIKSIAVLKNQRQKGYGNIMTAYAVNKIKNKGLTPILYTHMGNKAAVALWEKCGFKLNNKLYLLKIEDNKI